jgi:hypothetical protein
MEKDQAFVEMVVKQIVDNPDQVKTERKVDEMGVLIELTVAPEDMGKIIGKEGKTAKSVRTLLRVLGAKEHARVNLKIIEPEGGREVASESDSDTDSVSDTAADSAPEEVETVENVVADNSDEEDKVTPLEEKSTGVI